MKPKVFITREIPEDGIQLLRKYCEVKVYPQDQPIPRKELLKGVKWCDALLCLLTDKIDPEIIDANPNLKVIATYSVGFDNINVKYATQKGIPVCNVTSISSADAVAEHTFALMIAVSKHLVEADKFVRAGKYCGWSPTLFMGTELINKTLGIIGLGRIGSGVAHRAEKGMGMRVIYHDIVRNHQFERMYRAEFVSLKKLLKKSDFVSLHVPLLPATHHLIGKKELGLMKKTAFLINTARGAVVDEKALVAALQKKKIAGAALDVYEHEPLLTSGLAKLEHVILTPHTASSTFEAREEMSYDAANNILSVLKGHRAVNTINPEVYAKNCSI